MKLNYEYIKRENSLTIVFLHGWGMRGSSFDKIISHIDNNVSILKVDMFGFGDSDDPLDYFDTYEYAYQIFLLISKLQLKKIVLIGHSFGGRLTILLSSIFKINISFCMLTSSAGINRFSFLRWIRVKKYKILKWLINKNIISKSKIEKYGSVDYKNAKPILRKILIRVVNQNLKEYVNMINVKTVLVWDKKDTVTPYWLCKYLSKHITTAQVYLFKNGGHFTAFKNPVKFAFIINNCLVKAG